MKDEFKKYSESPGSLRGSQLTTTFGPGSIVQMEHDSVLVMGIDTWSSREEDYKTLNHPYLEQLLAKSHFKMPRQVGKHRVISCRSFPLWGVCSNPACARLQKHKAAPSNGKKFNCCDCKSEIYAAKFAAICSNGHLEEFPWWEWAHSRVTADHASCTSDSRLVFRARGKGPGLSDYIVMCLDCKASRSCAGATFREGLKDIISGCSGAMPWLGKHASITCDDTNGRHTPIYGIQIRSTSMYYPVTVTALYVPEWLHKVQKRITEKRKEITGGLKFVNYMDMAKSEYFVKEREEYSVDEICKQLTKRFTNRPNLTKESTEAQVRSREYNDLMNNEFVGDEYLEITKTEVREDLAEYIMTLKQIKRLTEMRVIRAFTREVPADPYLSEDDSAKYCNISNKNADWYPAIENRGEGFLFTLNEDRLHRWEKEPNVRSRCGLMLDALENLFPDMSREDPRIPARYTLLHTLAHVLIRGVAKVSGYGEASIRERIYSGQQYNGILLYTSTPSSDGSLGGLVRQGNTENFANLIRKSVQESTRCSRDPFCAEDNPEEMERAGIPMYNRVNASACYGCVLLPETSCENVNRLLDRRLLFDKEFGYFKEWVDTK